jgi:hypothetical protein
MNLTQTQVTDLAIALVALSKCHAKGELHVPTADIAKVAEQAPTSTTALLAIANRAGLVTFDPRGADWKWRLADSIVVGVHGERLCDPCKFTNSVEVQAIADARTFGGRWGNVCARHFVELDCSLGLGRGQLFRFEA